MEYKYHGIILGKNDIAETDRIYTVYSLEAGKVRLLAKGVRKSNAKLAGSLETFTLSEIFVAKSRGRGNITGAIVEENFSALKENIFLLEEVFLTLRIFDRLVTQEEQDEKIFFLLGGYLSMMNKLLIEKGEDLKMNILSAGFLFKLLSRLGYGFEMRRCLICDRRLQRGGNFFEASLGGAVCEKCLKKTGKKVRISDETVKIIRIFSQNKLENFGKIKIEKKDWNNLRIILNEAVQWVMN